MNASADLQLALVSPRCGFKQLDMLPNVTWGQNCLMSLAHSLAVQEAFDEIVEQPTDNSLTCKCKQPRTRPPPGMTRGHTDQTSVVQSRSEVNNASCAHMSEELASRNVVPSATEQSVVLTIALPPEAQLQTPRRERAPGRHLPIFRLGDAPGAPRLNIDRRQGTP
jgi:hypothetical protein